MMNQNELPNAEENVLIKRIHAMLRWLLDEGHITPQGLRQLKKILDEFEKNAGNT
jgi:sulfite reductase beta subunit-like hemoprotein